jgi:uncharacterized membrane protein
MVSGVPIAMAMVVVPGIAGSQLLNNAWQTYAGLVGIVDPVRTRPRRNHLRQLGLGGAKPAAWRYSPRSAARRTPHV